MTWNSRANIRSEDNDFRLAKLGGPQLTRGALHFTALVPVHGPVGVLPLHQAAQLGEVIRASFHEEHTLVVNGAVALQWWTEYSV
jgi:hypothetical protein